MSEENSNEEPTMEEILASIRKIISEDDDAPEETSEIKKPEPEPQPEPVAEVEPEPEPVVEAAPEPEVEPEPEEEDILDLTDMLDEEEAVVLEMPEPEPEPEITPEPEPAVAIDLSGDEVDPAEGYDAIMSSGPSYDASSQFGMLSELLTTGYQGSGNTLEDLVRELLKPMLRSWLDDNLPPLVERMVAKEIARLARVKKP